jgi:hypothetical protein
MPIAVTLALLLFWVAIAYRQYQRGDMVLAGIFLFVGIALTIYRIQLARRRSQAVTPGASRDSNPQNPIGK